MNAHLWANIFLGCFLFGFALTVISLLLGFGLHDGGAGHDGFQLGGGHDLNAGNGNHGFHVAGTPTHAQGTDVSAHPDVPESPRSFNVLSFLNYNTVVMFLTWFGAAGYLLLQTGKAAALVVLGGAIAAGFAGASIVFLFLHKFLLKGQTRMDPSEYYMPGTLARITSPIREGGIGEIVYLQGGTRKTAGACSDDQVAHSLGEEVVIIRYEKGIAYVRSPTYNKHLTTSLQPSAAAKLTEP